MTITDTQLDLRVADLAARHHHLGEALRHHATQTPDALFIRFLAYDDDPGGVAHDMTFAEADRRVDDLAAELSRHAEPGDRVAVLTAQSNAFVIGFLAALRAGLIAVPMFSPDLPGHGERLHAVIGDCDPAIALATHANHDLVRATVAGGRRDGRPVTVVVMAEHTGVVEASGDAAGWTPPTIDPGSVAYLQYTSGSTRLPAGVRITHRNVMVNSAQGIVMAGAGPGSTLVSWLPLFHDMGLVAVTGTALVAGMPTVLMDPVAFLMRPQRWLEELAKADRGVSAAPNFAYDFCAKRIPAAERDALDLSGVGVLFNGAEPVSSGTVQRFVDAFAGAGLPSDCVSPSYGLAEATVFVTTSALGPQGPRVSACDAMALSFGRVEQPRSDAPRAELVSCGIGPGVAVAVVDPARGEQLPDGEVGEVWVRGGNVADGYWGRPEESAAVFGQTLISHAGLPADGWLRTGDLGVVVAGTLAITGRRKDLIIVDGRNHYPQDIERTAEDAHEVVGRHRGAAFGVVTDAGERAVLVLEVSRHHVDGDWDQRAVVRAVTRAVSRENGLSLHEVVLVAPDTVPRTTSGKIARAACKQAYLTGALVPFARSVDSHAAGAPR